MATYLPVIIRLAILIQLDIFQLVVCFRSLGGGVAGVGAATTLDLAMGAAFGAVGGLPFAIFVGAGLGALGQATGDMVDGRKRGLDVVVAAGLGAGMGAISYGLGMLGHKGVAWFKGNDANKINGAAMRGLSWPDGVPYDRSAISVPSLRNTGAEPVGVDWDRPIKYEVIDNANGTFHVREVDGQNLPHQFSTRELAQDFANGREDYWRDYQQSARTRANNPGVDRPSGVIDGLMWDLSTGRAFQVGRVRRLPLRREFSTPATSSNALFEPVDIQRSISEPANLPSMAENDTLTIDETD